ncbi:DUF3467 domain-containing protein [Candidatus Roizmanbacteria bacterium]|nr:DUF3467 domain-containing protein [Candidatus Roizmanbacteria bacterium]
MADNKALNTREVKVNALSFIGTLYAQTVTITVTDNDVTLDFIYIHPNAGVTEGQIVSRVTLPRKAAEDISKIIDETIKKHESKKTKSD